MTPRSSTAPHRTEQLAGGRGRAARQLQTDAPDIPPQGRNQPDELPRVGAAVRMGKAMAVLPRSLFLRQGLGESQQVGNRRIGQGDQRDHRDAGLAEARLVHEFPGVSA